MRLVEQWSEPALPSDVLVLIVPRARMPEKAFRLDSEDESGARGLVRLAAAERFGIDPHELNIGASPRELIADRSLLGRARRPRRLWTSLSRSGDLVAVAIASRRIGIDLEALQTNAQAKDLLTLLHPHDRRRLSVLSGDLLRVEVTAAWTRVEAQLKQLGLGLSCDPSEVRVGAPNESRCTTSARVLTRVVDDRGTVTDPGGQAGRVEPAGIGGPEVPQHLVSIVWGQREWGFARELWARSRNSRKKHHCFRNE